MAAQPGEFDEILSMCPEDIIRNLGLPVSDPEREQERSTVAEFCLQLKDFTYQPLTDDDGKPLKHRWYDFDEPDIFPNETDLPQIRTEPLRNEDTGVVIGRKVLSAQSATTEGRFCPNKEEGSFRVITVNGVDLTAPGLKQLFMKRVWRATGSCLVMPEDYVGAENLIARKSHCQRIIGVLDELRDEAKQIFEGSQPG